MQRNLAEGQRLRLEREQKYMRESDIRVFGFSPADIEFPPAGNVYDQRKMVCGRSVKWDDYVDWVLDDKYTFIDIDLVYCMEIKNGEIEYQSLKSKFETELKVIPLKIVNAATGLGWNGRYFKYSCNFYNGREVDGVIGLYSETEEYADNLKPRQLLAYDKETFLMFTEKYSVQLNELESFFESYETYEREIFDGYIEKFDSAVRKR